MWRAEDLGAFLYDADLKQYVEITELIRFAGGSVIYRYCLNKCGLPARLFRLRCRRLAH